MNNLFYQVSGIFFIVFMLKMYFSKKRLVSIGNNIYITLMITNLAVLLLDIFSVFSVLYLGENSIISIILSKIYLSSIIVWIFLLIVYVYVESFKKIERIGKTEDLSFKKLVMKIAPFGLASIIGLMFLPTVPVKSINEIYFSGLGIYFIYAVSSICIILGLIRYIRRVKYIKKIKSDNILLVSIFGLFAILMGVMYPQFLISTFVMYFITFITYFSIDNPDLDLLYELELEKKQVEEAEVSKTDALLKASHEIRTPLNTILGFSQSILNGSIDNIKEDIKSIETASKDLLNTVNNILEIPNADAQELKLVYDKYNAGVLMKQIEALAKLKIEDKKFEFKVESDDKLPPFLYGDSIRIKQILLNIIYNAIKHTKEGYIHLKIGSMTIGNICRLIVSVKDTGIGMSTDQIDDIFNPKKIDTEKLKEGNVDLDLNLATIKKIINSMNGQISVESEYNEGTIVKISIDQKIVDIDSTKEEVVEEPKKLDFSGKKVLIVDDDKLNLKVASRMLKGYNVIIEEATSGEECLDKITNGNQYDLILLDDWMKSMGGIETLHQLDKIEKFNTPVVALTANAVPGMKEKYLKEGFNDYISKPIEREELDKVLHKYLKN
ncbi:MAG: response regulator [Bacilli bacterium]|nr:response regulator [Bacilli bacterium]